MELKSLNRPFVTPPNMHYRSMTSFTPGINSTRLIISITLPREFSSWLWTHLYSLRIFSILIQYVEILDPETNGSMIMSV